jgi:hypothetical protein
LQIQLHMIATIAYGRMKVKLDQITHV